ncbi:Fe2+ transport protein [Thermococcus sp. P6]|nr:FeoA family protein [Thermococcus sp. P6]ASJ10704.1 Fe2+ transport protein [Thermococcus sp. P6]
MIVPLSTMKPGERGVVVNILKGELARQRLTSIGIVPGATVQVLESYPWGPVIISTGGVRVAVGKGLASGVMVRKL